MTQTLLHILLISSNKQDYDTITELLNNLENTINDKQYHLDWVSTYPAALSTLTQNKHHVYLLADSIEQNSNLDILHQAKHRGCQVPIILVAEEENYQLANQAIELGAANYLLKQQSTPFSIAHAIHQAIKHNHIEQTLHYTKQRFQYLVENAGDMFIAYQLDGKIVEANKPACHKLGYSHKELLQSSIINIDTDGHSEGLKTWLENLKVGHPITELSSYRRKDKSIFPIEARTVKINRESDYLVLVIAKDITERRRLEDELWYRLEMENMLAKISTHFINLPSHKIDNGITSALRDLTFFANGTGGIVFRFLFESSPPNNVTITHQWFINNQSETTNLVAIPNSVLSWCATKLKQLEFVALRQLDDLPTTLCENETSLNPQTFKPCLFVPIISEEKLYGAIGFFGKVGESRDWLKKFISLLKLTANVFVNALKRKQTEEELLQHRNHLEEAVKSRTYELTQTNQRLQLGINERRRIEEALRQSEKRYRDFFENAPVAIWEQDFSEVKKYITHLQKLGITDLKTYFDEHPEDFEYCVKQAKIVDVNLATIRMCKADSKETFFANIDKIFIEESYDAYKEIFIALANGQTTFRGEAIAQTLLGEKKHTVLRLFMDTAYTNTWSKVLLSITGITKRKEAEEKLKQYADQLKEANGELSQYAYVVSHDLKAPLRAIHNYANFLQEDLKDKLETDEQEYLDGLLKAVYEGERLVEDLLELARIDRGNVPVESVNVGLYLQDLLITFNLSPNVEITMADDWPVINVEPVLLRQIFQNLIVNALKFNKSTPKQIELGWQPIAKNIYEFYIKDNGLGIAPRYQQQIFRVFERLHTPSEYEGTGIGLAIVKKAVGKLGGTIRLESTLGQGSTFFFTLPKITKVGDRFFK